jgi:hypothetical protein
MTAVPEASMPPVRTRAAEHSIAEADLKTLGLIVQEGA